MILTEIELKDWGPHRRIQAQGLGPVVGLLGPNGAGKSMFLRALEYAFTGKIEGSADSYVRNQGQEGAANNASVRVRFTKNGQQGLIFRQVGKTAKRSLEWEGRTVTKAKDVDELLAQILGADKLALSNAIFIAQGDLSRLLFGTPGERQELFSRLMLVSYVEQRQNVVDNKIKSLSGGLQDFTLLLDEAKAQVASDAQLLANLEYELQSQPDRGPDLELLKELLQVRSRFKETEQELRSAETRKLDAQAALNRVRGEGLVGEALDAELERTRADRDRQQTELDRARELEAGARGRARALERVAETQDRVSDLRTQLEPLSGWEQDRARVPELRRQAQVRAQWEERTRTWEQRKSELTAVMTEQQRAKTVYDARTPELEREEVRAKAELVEAQERRAELRTQYQTVDRALKLVDGGQPGTCPLCGTQLAESMMFTAERRDQLLAEGQQQTARVEALERRVRELTEERQKLGHDKMLTQDALVRTLTDVQRLADERQALNAGDVPSSTLQKQIEALAESVQKAELLTQNLNRLEEDLERAKNALDALPDTGEPTPTPEQIGERERELVATRVRVTELERREQSLGHVNRDLKLAESQVLDSKARHQTVVDKLVEIEQRVEEKNLTTDTSVSGLEATITLVQEQQDRRSETRGRIQQARDSLNRSKDRLETLERRAEEDQERRLLIDELRRLRQALTKDGVPAAYIRYRFEQLVGLTQEHLTNLDANFAVEQDPETFASFRFRRLDQDSDYLMPQDKLSGGQRTRLTIAFLLAVQKLVIPEVGFLVLDEPGQGLDGEGVDRLRDLFAGLQHTMGGNENQIMVCDHRPEFESAFSSTIKLKGGLQ
jgi:DNA repair exonuclease SbcCD ATPase subunit